MARSRRAANGLDDPKHPRLLPKQALAKSPSCARRSIWRAVSALKTYRVSHRRPVYFGVRVAIMEVPQRFGRPFQEHGIRVDV
jgi:hypothetical protein